MKSYLKLVHMEVLRFRYLLAGLAGLTTAIQLSALISFVNHSMDNRDDMGMPVAFSFVDAIFDKRSWFDLSIVIGFVTVGIYIFAIWYRDWFGRSAYIYRLLTLPIPRMSLYWSKISAILLLVFGLVAFQAVLLAVLNVIFGLIVPEDRMLPSFFNDAVVSSQALALILPRHLDQFAFTYGFGIILVMMVFTAILLERSYRLAGLIGAIVYLMVSLFALVFMALIYHPFRTGSYLYPEEVIALELVIGGLIVFVSIWLGTRLIRKKISV